MKNNKKTKNIKLPTIDLIRINIKNYQCNIIFDIITEFDSDIVTYTVL